MLGWEIGPDSLCFGHPGREEIYKFFSAIKLEFLESFTAFKRRYTLVSSESISPGLSLPAVGDLLDWDTSHQDPFLVHFLSPLVPRRSL